MSVERRLSISSSLFSLFSYSPSSSSSCSSSSLPSHFRFLSMIFFFLCFLLFHFLSSFSFSFSFVLILLLIFASSLSSSYLSAFPFLRLGSSPSSYRSSSRPSWYDASRDVASSRSSSSSPHGRLRPALWHHAALWHCRLSSLRRPSRHFCHVSGARFLLHGGVFVVVRLLVESPDSRRPPRTPRRLSVGKSLL